MKFASVAAFACVCAACVSLSPSAQALGARPAAAAGWASLPPQGRVLVISGRAYRVHCSLRVFIGGAPLDPDVGEQTFPMQCVVSLTPVDGGIATGTPARLTLTLNEGAERRIVVLNLIPNDTQQPVETAAYMGTTWPFAQTDGAVNAAVSVREWRRVRTLPLGNVPVEIIPLP